MPSTSELPPEPAAFTDAGGLILLGGLIFSGVSTIILAVMIYSVDPWLLSPLACLPLFLLTRAESPFVSKFFAKIAKSTLICSIFICLCISLHNFFGSGNKIWPNIEAFIDEKREVWPALQLISFLLTIACAVASFFSFRKIYVASADKFSKAVNYAALVSYVLSCLTFYSTEVSGQAVATDRKQTSEPLELSRTSLKQVMFRLHRVEAITSMLHAHSDAVTTIQASVQAILDATHQAGLQCDTVSPDLLIKLHPGEVSQTCRVIAEQTIEKEVDRQFLDPGFKVKTAYDDQIDETPVGTMSLSSMREELRDLTSRRQGAEARFESVHSTIVALLGKLAGQASFDSEFVSSIIDATIEASYEAALKPAVETALKPYIDEKSGLIDTARIKDRVLGKSQELKVKVEKSQAWMSEFNASVKSKFRNQFTFGRSHSVVDPSVEFRPKVEIRPRPIIP